jgi:plasmid stabilization system protein ParE
MGEYLIVWRVNARQQYLRHLSYALQEFGAKAFYHWVESIKEMEAHLRENPKAYSLVPQLIGKRHEYRGCIVMENFKVVYTYDDRRKVINIVTIWDMRMNPQKLVNRLK